MKTILANWKSNKTLEEGKKWLKQFNNLIRKNSLNFDNFRIILFPPLTHLAILHLLVDKYNLALKLGAQNISPFEEGAYTGEVSARSVVNLVNYVLIGHSERRKYFAETDKMVAQKVKMAVKYGLIPVICISNLNQVNYLITTDQLPITNFFILYEPLFAIGSGQPDNPENANKFAQRIKKIVGKKTQVLYGGSVTEENVISFLSKPEISGVGVGGASLDPYQFYKIIKNAQKIKKKN